MPWLVRVSCLCQVCLLAQTRQRQWLLLLPQPLLPPGNSSNQRLRPYLLTQHAVTAVAALLLAPLLLLDGRHAHSTPMMRLWLLLLLVSTGACIHSSSLAGSARNPPGRRLNASGSRDALQLRQRTGRSRAE